MFFEKILELTAAHKPLNMAWAEIAAASAAWIRAESCEIYLAEHPKPGELVAKARWAEMSSDGAPPLRAQVSSVQPDVARKIEFPLWLLTTRRSINATHEEILQAGFTEADLADANLRGGTVRSVLSIPLLRNSASEAKTTRLFGCLVFKNARIEREDSGNFRFSQLAEVAASNLAGYLLQTVQDRYLLDAYADLLAVAAESRTPGEVPPFYAILLQKAVYLVGGNRGDLALWDNDEKQLKYVAVTADTKDPRVAVGFPVPEDSFIWKFWSKNEEYERISNVRALTEGNYLEASPDTKSELGYRITLGPTIDGQKMGRTLGVLNVEASEIGWFDDTDVDRMKCLARQAATAFQLARGNEHLLQAVRSVFVHNENLQLVANRVLAIMEEVLGFEEGLVYQLDETGKMLVGIGWRVHQSITDQEVSQYAQHVLDDGRPSLAKSAHYSPTYVYSAVPKGDPSVSQEGLERFKIETSMIGVPLIVQGERLGSMLVWSRRNPAPEPRHGAFLRPFADLLASKIVIERTNSRLRAVARELEALLDLMPLSVVIKDQNSRFKFANKAARTEFRRLQKPDVEGQDDYAVFGKKYGDLYHKSDQQVMQGLPDAHFIINQEPHLTASGEKIVDGFKLKYRFPDTGAPGVLVCYWDHSRKVPETGTLLQMTSLRMKEYLRILDNRVVGLRILSGPKPDEAILKQLRRCDNTLRLISDIIDSYFPSSDGETIQAGLTRLADRIKRLFDEEDRVKCEFALDDFKMNPEETRFINYIISEILIHSIQSAFRMEEKGPLRIEARRDDRGKVRWSITSICPSWHHDMNEDVRRSSALKLAESIAKSALDGTVIWPKEHSQPILVEHTLKS